MLSDERIREIKCGYLEHKRDVDDLVDEMERFRRALADIAWLPLAKLDDYQRAEKAIAIAEKALEEPTASAGKGE